MKKLLTVLAVFLLIMGCSAKKTDVMDYNDSGNYYSEEGYQPDKYGGGYAEDASYMSNNSGAAKDQKLVYTSTITLETKQYDDLIKEVGTLVGKYEGFNEYVHENTGNYRSTNLTVRIPSGSFDAFLEELRNGEGTVTDITINVDNITKNYNDTTLRIQTLEAQHERLLELLKKAATLQDIIQLEDRLSEVEYELEVYNNQLNQMDSQVAYSTITVIIREVVVYTDVRTSYLQRLSEAFKGSLNNFIQGVGDFIIDLVYALPALVMIAGLILLFRKPVRKLWEKKGSVLIKKKAKESETDLEK